MSDFQEQASTSQKILAAVSYFSYFFLPVIFPLIVWIVGSDKPYIKWHAKRAFWSQLLPVLFGLVCLVALGVSGAFAAGSSPLTWGWISIALMAITALVAMGSLIYNVAQAIRVLIN